MKQGWCTVSRITKSGLSFPALQSSKNMLTKLSGLQAAWAENGLNPANVRVQAAGLKLQRQHRVAGQCLGEQNVSGQKIPTLKFSCTSLKQKGVQM